MEKKKILIIKISSMGDVIFNIPLANILKQNNCEVHWLVGEKGIKLLENNPCVDKVIFTPFEKWKKEKNKLKNLKEIFQIIKELRKEHYDISFDTQMRLKSLFFNLFCGAKRRIVSEDAKEFSKFGANEIIPKKREINSHVTESYLEFARYLGFETNNIIFSLPKSSDETVDKISDLLKNIDKTKPIITIAPSTTWIGKHWDKDNWKTLVSKLYENNNLIFTGGKNDFEYIEDIKDEKGINLAGQTSISELIELLRNTDLLLSLDSGTTHLAWAVQSVKILSVYCCTPKNMYLPYGQDNKYFGLENTLCTPCHHKKCKRKNNKYVCTKSPSVDEVFEQIQKIMSMRDRNG